MLFYFVEKVYIVDIKAIIEDYALNFAGKTCLFKTGYQQLPEFCVQFELSDLFHLLGIHKLNTGLYAGQWLEQVRGGDFDLGDFASHPSMKDIRPRVANYDFFYEIFYRDQVQVCVLDKDLSRNTMRLSVVFFKEKKRQVVVLGLKKDKLGYFRPATLHEASGNPYARNRKTVIKEVKWLS